jgi:hypothetical protein
MLLRTFAFGIAAVWLAGGLEIAWRDKAVRLPGASDDVLYIHPRSSDEVWGPTGAGGNGSRLTYEGYCLGPNLEREPRPTIKRIRSGRSDYLRFRVVNITGCDMYLPAYQLRREPLDSSMAYSIECPDKDGQLEAVESRDVGPRQEILHDSDSFIFDVYRPKSKGPCLIGIGYYFDRRRYEILNRPDWFADLSPEDQKILNDSGWCRLQIISVP